MASGPASVVAAIPRPPVLKRALIAASLLAGFYVTTLGLALAFAALAALCAWVDMKGGSQNGLVIGGCLVLSVLLVASLFRVKRTRFVAPSPPLAEHEAPELFHELGELARAAGTAPPSSVHLAPGMQLSVVEDRGRRILVIGVGLLARMRRDELRAGLAHELGHFAFGDTRLLGLVALVHAVFRSTFEMGRGRSREFWFGAELASALGGALAKLYARAFFALTRPLDREAELAADALAARLAGPEALVSLLEKLHVDDALFGAFTESDLSFAIASGAVPDDPLRGFATFCARMHERGLAGEIERAARNAKSDPFDTHPALEERTAAARRLPPLGAPVQADARSGTSLVAVDLDRWLSDWLAMRVEATSPHGELVRARWEELPSRTYAPFWTKQSLGVGARFASVHPHATSATALFAALVRDLAGGHLEAMVVHFDPDIARCPPHLRAAVFTSVAGHVMHAVFAGALLEQGATVAASIGEPALLFTWRGSVVAPGVIAREAMVQSAASAELVRWAETLTASVSG